MPQGFTVVDGKLVITGDDTAQDHVPLPDAPAAPAPKAKPKPKPKGKAAPAKSWWQSLTHAIANEAKFVGKTIQGFNQKQSPVSLNPFNLGLPPAVRQAKAAATYGALQTAGEGAIAIVQRMKGSKFADPRASRPGRLLNSFTRMGYAFEGAKQPEDLTQAEKGIIDDLPRSAGVEAGAFLATRRPAGALLRAPMLQGPGVVKKGLRLGTQMGIAHGVGSFAQDSTLGNMSNMAEAVTGQKVPGAVDPLTDDRVTAGLKSVVPNMLGGEALGLGITAGARALGKAGSMFPNIARQKRALRANTEHATANERVKATGLVEDVDGRQQFTEAGRSKPAPLALTADERTQQVLDRFGPPSKPAPDAPPPPDAPPAPAVKESLTVAEEPTATPIDPAEEFLDNGNLPEIADVQKMLDGLDDDELAAVAIAGADGGPVLQHLNDAVATRPTPQPRFEVSEDATGMPTANLSELYLNGAGDLEPWIKQFDKIPVATLQELAHPDASPRLFDLIHAATGRDWEAFTRADIIGGIQELSAQGATILPNRLRGDVTLTPTGQVVARPKEFQYKENVNAQGEQMGQSLGGVTKWNPNLEGVVDTFTDPKAGETVVVNGHNRRALADRLGVPSLITREVDATTPPAARAEGAMANIAAGAGTPFDAATFIKATGLRDAAQLDAAGIPTDKGYGRQGLALSKLPAEIFQDAVNEAHDLGRYLDLGASGLDDAGMRGAYQVLQQRPKMSAGAFREVIGKAGEQGSVITSSPQGSLFGDDVLNPIAQWAELVADVRQGLSREKRIFGNSIKNAGALGEAGVADVNTNLAGQRVTDASHALDLFDRLKNAPGPLADVLNRGAAEIASGSKPGVIAKQVQREIADNIEVYLNDAGLKTPGRPDAPAPAAPEPPAAITPEVLPPVPRADLERHALQRAIANGEVRPTETGPVEVPEGLGGDWGDMQHEQALGADFYSQDTLMGHEAAKAMREAEGYDLMTWEEKQQAGAVGGEWLATVPDAITPEVVQPASKGSISEAMSDVIQRMKASDIKSFSILASQLFESDWSLERNGKWKGMTKDEARAAYIQEFGERLQEAQNTPREPVLPSNEGKPRKLSEIMRDLIDAMKASDQRMEELGERTFELRRQVMDLELGPDLGDVGELPPAARKALVASEVSNAPPFVFPGDLEKARPERQGNRELLFESDLDRIAFLLAKAKPGSKAATQYREALAAQGFDADLVQAHGALVKKAVTKGVKESDIDPTNTPSVVNATDGGYARIPVQPFGGDNPRLPLPEQTRQAAKAQQRITDLKDQINKGGCGL